MEVVGAGQGAADGAGALPEPVTPGALPEPATPGALPEPATPGALPEPATPGALPEPATPGALPEPATPGIVGEPGQEPAPETVAEGAAPEPLAVEPVPERLGLDEAGLDTLFRTARTVWAWQARAVGDDVLRRLYDLLKLGPTSANCSPARFMFLRTDNAKERLRTALSAGNAEKAMGAPVVCIVAHDPRFYEDLPRLYPGVDARSWFAGDETLASETAFRNGTLQGAYLLLAARAVGLDCAPMSGFDNERVNEEFLVAQGWKSNFLVALGHGERSGLAERGPRLSFDEACRLL